MSISIIVVDYKRSSLLDEDIKKEYDRNFLKQTAYLRSITEELKETLPEYLHEWNPFEWVRVQRPRTQPWDHVSWAIFITRGAISTKGLQDSMLGRDGQVPLVPDWTEKVFEDAKKMNEDKKNYSFECYVGEDAEAFLNSTDYGKWHLDEWKRLEDRRNGGK